MKFTGENTLHAPVEKAWDALLKFWLIEVRGVQLAWRSALSYQALLAKGIQAQPAQCRLATFCIREGFALLHSSPGYDAFEEHLGLTVARAGG